MHVIEDRLSPGDTIRAAYNMCFQYNCTLIAVESNAYQYSLLYWFNFIGAQLEIIGIMCVPIYSGSLSKVTRILNMFKELLSGDTVIHPDCKSQVHYQISQFRPLKRDNVDGILDLLTYSPRVIEEFGHFIAMQAPVGSQQYSDAKVLTVSDNCSC